MVPVDDVNTVVLAWANFGERGDPPAWNTPEGIDQIEQGEVIDRPYEQRQRAPADYEAVVGMGPITSHEREHLAPTDRGIALLRKRLKRCIRDLQEGKPPLQPSALAAGAIPTYGGDTVLNLPPRTNGGDRRFLRETAAEIMELHFKADTLHGDARDRFMIEKLIALEVARR